jgi:putative endonuclease
MKSRQALGQWGEQVAATYLEDKGYTIHARNVRTPFGEIDLIVHQAASERHTLNRDLYVFVEVKARASRTLGKPEISVGERKRAHLLAAIQFYIQEIANPDLDWRVDVIAVERFRSGELPVITHFENALSDI